MRGTARDIAIEDFDYPLPKERIARYPLARREEARQLRYQEGQITEGSFADLPEHLPTGTLLVGNRTRVIHARLHFPLEGEKRPIEIFCLDPVVPHDYALSLGSLETVRWKCLIGGNRRWKEGALTLEVEMGNRRIPLKAERVDRQDNTFLVDFSWQADEVSFGELIASAGEIPLPPYLNRAAEAEDRDRYQTVFASEEGSVAAPTAGLHFTEGVLDRLGQRGIDWREITLHVGAGTFKPVSTPSLMGHTMHREFFSVGLDFLLRLREQLASDQPIVSVGTTSMRCLESLFYLGAVLLDSGELHPVGQWVGEEPTSLASTPLPAISALITHLETSGQTAISTYTRLLLAPPMHARIVDGLITNFHQPRSTLLLLVASLVGEDWKRIYDYALKHDFRFLSYGDSSLLWRRTLAK